MANKTPAIISAIITILMLILLGVLSVFMQMIALNGVSERQGTTAMVISLVCQGIGLILAAIVAAWISNLVITKFKWNKALAVLVAVIAGVLLGGTLSVLAFFLSIPLTGIG